MKYMQLIIIIVINNKQLLKKINISRRLSTSEKINLKLRELQKVSSTNALSKLNNEIKLYQNKNKN